MRRLWIVCVAALFAAPAAAQDPRTWVFDDNPEAPALEFGAPESDDILVAFSCEPAAKRMSIVESVASKKVNPGTSVTFKLTAGNVIGKSLLLLRNTITLDIGERDGIKADMPVISETGLVGKVIATSEHYSIAQLMQNKDFRASAKIQRTRVDGIIAWGGGDVLRLKNVSKTEDVKAGDIVSPGHVFPLRAQPGGVLTRRGHTEGTVDLTILAGLKPAGVLCELMNPDGTMARGEQIDAFVKERNIPVLTIAELADFRMALAAAREMAEETV